MFANPDNNEVKIPMSSAISIFHTIKAVGYDGLKAYTLANTTQNHINMYLSDVYNHDKEIHQEHVEIALEPAITICFNGANYIKWWLQDDVTKLVEHRYTSENINCLSDKLTDGIYYLDYDCDQEGHSFVLLIQNDVLIYGGTYGGPKTVNIVTHKKSEYINRFINAMDGDLDAYRYVFNISPEDLLITEANMVSLSVKKSTRYV